MNVLFEEEESQGVAVSVRVIIEYRTSFEAPVPVLMENRTF